MNRIRLLLPLTVLFSILCLAAPAWAVDERRTDTEVVERALSAEEMAAQLARAAEERKLIEGKRVSFEEVLKDPDNLDLNFFYARRQVAENNLLGASGTLERILMINPKLAPIRFFYGVVLYRLDNLKEAEREFRILLAEEELPEGLRISVEGELKKIRLRRKMTRFTIRQNAGYGLDSNRNSAPNSKTNLSRNLPVPLSGTDLRRRDTNILVVNTTNVTHDLGFQAGHDVFGEFTYYLQEQTQVDNLDLQSFGGKTGGTFKHKIANVTPSFYFSHLFLSRESFLRTQGFDIALDRPFGKRWSASAVTSVERQNYMNIADNTTGAERKGPQVRQDILLNYLLTPTMRLSAGIGYTYKQAEEQFNARKGLGLNGSHLWLLGKGQYLLQSLETDFDYYNEPDFSRANMTRKDKSIRFRSSYGAPLSLLRVQKILPEYLDTFFGNITVTVTYEFFRVVSNVTNFTYNNHKFQGVIGKTWEF